MEGERCLLFFIIFVSVLNFESLLIVDSYPAVRGDISALHDVSLTAAPFLGPALAAEGLHCWLNVTEVCFEKVAMRATWIVDTKLLTVIF